MKNLVLENPIDVNLKPVKDTDLVNTALELSTTKARITNLEVNDLLKIDSDAKMTATKKLYLDGGSDTYIHEQSANLVEVVAGDDVVVKVATQTANSGNLIYAPTGTCIGFDQVAAVFDATDTSVYFNRNSNKMTLNLTDDIVDIHLNFPNVSCNCLLILFQDATGGRDITNWKTFNFEGAYEGVVKFAGGSNPDLTDTASKADIVSLYWDNRNNVAYGTITKNF